MDFKVRRMSQNFRGCAQSNSCSSSCSPGPDEWILCAVGTLPIEMAKKRFQGFTALSFSLWQTASCLLILPSVDKTLPACDCTWGIGEHHGLVLFLSDLFPKQLPQLPHCLSERRVGAAEVCRVTWYLAMGCFGTSCSEIQPCWSLFNTWGQWQQIQVHFLVPTLNH